MEFLSDLKLPVKFYDGNIIKRSFKALCDISLVVIN